MTKYEWEKELRKDISRLPAEEISRILDYYSELFEDKAESGLNEKEIIKEFGNPFDVAYKILREFDELGINENVLKEGNEKKGSEKEDGGLEKSSKNSLNTQSEPKFNSSRVAGENLCVSDMKNEKKTNKKSNKKSGKKSNAFATFMKFLFLLPFFIISLIFWPVVAALILSGGAMVVGGAIEIVVSFFTMAASVGAGVASLGVAVGAVGLGIIFVMVFKKIAKLGFKATCIYLNGRKEKSEEIE